MTPPVFVPIYFNCRTFTAALCDATLHLRLRVWEGALSRVPWMGEVGLALRHRVCDENLLSWAWWLEGRTVMLGTVVYFQPDVWA